MENTSYAALSRQQVLKSKMQLIANNIANVSTPGYRGQNMVFKEYLSKPDAKLPGMSMVLNYGQYQNTDTGTIRQTGNPLDIALNGPGYFGVTGPGNMEGYSKSGNLQISPEGELVTAVGYPVQGEGGGPINIPDDATNIRIAKDGTISSDDGELGKIKIVEFSNEQDLRPMSNGLYVYEGAPNGEVENTELIQGALEDSNVNAIQEMSKMIEVSRYYQNTARMMQTEHERQRSMIQELTRTN
jgi:flagellar basal-body rod protein FlgF